MSFLSLPIIMYFVSVWLWIRCPVSSVGKLLLVSLELLQSTVPILTVAITGSSPHSAGSFSSLTDIVSFRSRARVTCNISRYILHTSEKPRPRASQHSTIPELSATLLTPACQLSCANIFVSEIILCWCGSHTGGVSVRIPPTRVSGDSVVETTCSGPSSSWLSDIRCEPASAGGSPQQSFSSYLSSLITLQQIHKHQYWPEHWAVVTWPTLNIFLLLSTTSAPS